MISQVALNELYLLGGPHDLCHSFFVADVCQPEVTHMLREHSSQLEAAFNFLKLSVENKSGRAAWPRRI